MDAVLRVAREHLAAELGCKVDDCAVIESEAVTWRDSSLGCPEAGMMYMQMLMPGYRVTLEHAGQRYVVHTDQGGNQAVRCNQPQDHLPADAD